MATHDYVIANGTGNAVRSDLNNALAAIVSNNSSSSEPSTKYAYQWWADTTTGQLKLRNSANNAWVTIFELDGTMLMEDGTVSAPGLAFASDLNTGFFRSAADTLAIATAGAQRVTVDSSGRLLVGTSSALTTDSGCLFQLATSAAGNICLGRNDTTTVSGENLGAIRWYGNDSSGTYEMGASIEAVADLDHATGDKPTRLVFSTTADGASSPTERMRIDSSGNVGINNTSPTRDAVGTDSLAIGNNTKAASLDLYGNTKNYAIFSGNVGQLAFYSLSDNTERMRIDSSGNVGIGETSADTRLHVKASSSTNTGIFIQNSNGATNSSADLFFGNWSGSSTTTPQARIQALNKNVSSAATDLVFSIYSGTSTLERMRLDSSGRLLVGASTASSTGNAAVALLEVSGNKNGATASSVISIKRGEAASAMSGNDTLGRLIFTGLTGGDFAYIQASVDGSPSGSDFPGRLMFFTCADGASSATEAVRITAEQNLMLSQSGSGIFVGTTTDGAFRIGRSSFAVSTGTLFIGNAAIQVSSDARLKENIEDTNLDALDAISRINIKDFTWNDPSDISFNNRNARGKWTGLIAQELVDVLPFVVNAPRKEEDGSIDHDSESIWTLDQSQLCPVLIKAVQQQQEIIAGLESRLAALEAG